MMDCYDRRGNPISLDDYVRLLGRDNYRRVALTHVNGYTVSTVWLGMDHGWAEGPPVIFETMVFAFGTVQDFDCHRYSTEAEALAGHEEVVTLVRATT